MQNLEMKVRCSTEESFKAIRTRVLQNGANYQHTLHQRDTYFWVPRGRLKLREWKTESATSRGTNILAGDDHHEGQSGAVLISYTRPDEEGSRLSDVQVSPINDAATLRQVLTSSLGTLVVVEKVREIYHYRHTHIHLDRVIGLGTFVELETEFGTSDTVASEEEALHEQQEIKKLLRLESLPVIAGSYSDLLIQPT